MATSQQTSKPLSIIKILNEAFKLPTKNFALILPIFVLSFISFSLLFIVGYVSVNPITADLTSNFLTAATITDPKSPEYSTIHVSILKNLGDLIRVEAIVITVNFIASSLVTIATLRVFSATKERGLKGPMITILIVKLFNIGCSFLLGAITFSVLFLFANGSMILTALAGVILVFLGFGWFLYLAFVWSVGIVVSVVADEYGLQAISEAGRVIGGRRRQATVLAVIEIMIGVTAYGVYYIVKGYVLPPSTLPQLVIGVLYAAVVASLNMFEWAVFMVFYSDCKRCDGEEAGIDMGGFMYGVVPTIAEI